MPVELKHGWIVDFTTTMKKIGERKKYDEVWELIKKKNGWSWQRQNKQKKQKL